MIEVLAARPLASHSTKEDLAQRTIDYFPWGMHAYPAGVLAELDEGVDDLYN